LKFSDFKQKKFNQFFLFLKTKNLGNFASFWNSFSINLVFLKIKFFKEFRKFLDIIWIFLGVFLLLLYTRPNLKVVFWKLFLPNSQYHKMGAKKIPCVWEEEKEVKLETPIINIPLKP
jgi:hypothetical protein